MATTENEEIPHINHPLMRWFSQDPVDTDITAFSSGDVWLYMYRETLIGFINQRDQKGWFMRWDKPLYYDGFTSQHLLTRDHIKTAVDDTMIDNGSISYLEHAEMVEAAFRAVSEEISSHIEERLLGKTPA